MSSNRPILPTQEHQFASYVRILGKGKTGSRSLSQEEARTAFGMILRGEAREVQVGAFLMLLRVKEETGEELAGFVQACREQMAQPAQNLTADLDWSSYAGKKQQHPWFVLSILLLAGAGYRLFVHGADGHTPGRLYTEQALEDLGLPIAQHWLDVDTQLKHNNFSYLPLRRFCPALNDLIQLRPLLGLRSPVNTLTRMLNPLRAPCSIQSIFHPAYAALHQEADVLLGQERAAVFKGDSGEVEIKPQADTRIMSLLNKERSETVLSRQLTDRPSTVEQPAVEPLRALWRGESDDSYGTLAVQQTASVAMCLLQPELAMSEAAARVKTLWLQRDKARLT